MSVKVLTVLSSDSMDFYPENSVARFRNNIDLQLDPSKRYEACLHSVSFVRSWYNFLRSEDYHVTYRNKNTSRNNRVVIEPGYYDRQTFFFAVKNRNQQSENVYANDRSCAISFDNTSFRFSVTFTQEFSMTKKLAYDSVVMSADLARKLGFGDGSSDRTLEWSNGESTQVFYSDYPVNFDPIDFFCVNTSLIKPTHNIGQHRYSVLALVSSKASYGDRETYTAKDPLWFEVSKEEMLQPEFVLTTLTGRLVPFEFGTSSLTLLVKEIDDYV